MKELNRFRQFLTEGVIKEDQPLDENEGFVLVNDISAKFKEAKGWGLEISTIKDWADEYYTDSTDSNFGTEEMEDLMGWLKREYYSKDGRGGFRNFFGDDGHLREQNKIK